MDITTNSDYKSGDMDVRGIMASQVYSYSVEYKTLVDEKWSANEQRRAQWSHPRRSWTLEFQKTPEGGRKFEEFFHECRGRFKAFKFKWSKTYEDLNDMGGDDVWYTVRFNSDSLKQTVDYLGYRVWSIEIVEVRNLG